MLYELDGQLPCLNDTVNNQHRSQHTSVRLAVSCWSGVLTQLQNTHEQHEEKHEMMLVPCVTPCLRSRSAVQMVPSQPGSWLCAGQTMGHTVKSQRPAEQQKY